MIQDNMFRNAQQFPDSIEFSPLSGIEKLGFDLDQIKKIRKALKLPSGIIIVAGYALDGKTTTIASMTHEFDCIGTRPIVELQYSVEVKNSNHIQMELGAFKKYVVSDDINKARAFISELPPASIIVIGKFLGMDWDFTFHNMLVEKGHLVITEMAVCSIEQLQEKLLNLNSRECLKKNVSVVIMQNLREFDTNPKLSARIYSAEDVTHSSIFVEK